MNFKLWFLAFSFSLLASGTSLANTLPTAENINNLAENTKLTAGTFMQKCLPLRLRYEYRERFLDGGDRDNLYKLAKRAGDHLQAIAEDQQNLKRQIEDYQGDDWDQRYGKNGLWRKLSLDLYRTILSKCEIDLYLALATEAPQSNDILHNILAQIDLLEGDYRSADRQFLRIRILAALARTEPAYRSRAIEQFDSLMAQADAPDSIYFGAALAKIKLTGSADPGQLNALVEKLAKSNCADDLELVLSMAFLQRRYDRQIFEKVAQAWPQTKDFLGSLVLSDLSALTADGQSAEQTSVFEAELAAQAAWENGPQDYKMLLDHLCNMERFQRPLILYVAAVASAESQPAKTVELLIKASKLQQTQKSNMLAVDAEKIAEQAAKSAYNLSVADSNNCQVALDAFENYYIVSGGKIDEESERLYAVVLGSCGRDEKAREMLRKIADRPDGKHRDRAELELAAYAIRQKQYENTEQKNKLVKKFCGLIADCNGCEHVDEAMELLSETIDEIDRMQQAKEFPEIIQDYKKLAQFCYDCLEGRQRQQAGLYLAEVSVFAAAKQKDKLSEAEKLLDDMAVYCDSNNPDYLRCRARLSAEQGRFDEAAGLWSQIAEILKKDELAFGSTTGEKRRSWKWWRAKFYELDCWAKMPNTQKKDVLHTIEVLKSSLSDIPPPWAEKLLLLKHRLGD